MTEPPSDPGRLRRWGAVYLKGAAMGAADAIPGVSGGTIALIVGIYERLVDAIAGLPAGVPTLLDGVSGRHDEPRTAAGVRTLRGLDVPFLAVLGLGVITGVVAVANVVDVALTDYRAATYALFFGVILASPLVLRSEISLREARPLAAGLLGVVLAFLVSGLPTRQASVTLPLLFVVGAVAIAAMVLPGISGSLMLVVLGAYDTMTGAVSDLTAAVLGADGSGVVEPLSVLVVFAAGAVVGLLSVARAVSWAIDTHRTPTMTFLVGVMFGALRSPAREILGAVEAFTPGVIASLLVAGGVGALLVVGLEYTTGGIGE